MAKEQAKPDADTPAIEASHGDNLATWINETILAALAEAERAGHKITVEIPEPLLSKLNARLAEIPEAAQAVEFVPEAPKGEAPPQPPVTDGIGYQAFKGGAFEVSLPAAAPMKLHLFGAIEVAPGGPAKEITLPPGDAGEHQLLDLQRHFAVAPAKPKAATPDPRMTAAAK